MFGSRPAPVPPGKQRHALGMPAGSIRAILALGILGLMWLLVLRYDDNHRLPMEFIYLEYLMLLMLASYFTAHGKTIGSQVSARQPLGLPTGVIRLVLMAGYIGLAAYMWYENLYLFAEPPSGPPALLILLLLTSYFGGYVLTRVVQWFSGSVLPYAYQDFQAWVALIALLGMGILVMWYVFISPSLTESRKIDLGPVEAILAAAVGFYFGARS